MARSCPFLAGLEAQERLTEARYDDGVSEIHSSGADPVQVSRIVFDQDGDTPSTAGLSTLFTTWGQFLDHDIVLSPEDADEGVLDLIGMPHDIARSMVAEEIDAGDTIAPTNVVTWAIDGSMVYGSTDARMDDLRSFEGGQLRVQEDLTSAAGMLPDADPDSFMAGDIDGADPVYLAGDIRANENPNLLSLHTMFVREHNHWAERLAKEHPDWTDQQLYDAARSIVEFEIQAITYDEWLPHLIGDAIPETYTHDPNVSGQMSVEFSTAAFRFGHTLVSDQIDRIADDGSDAGSMGLMDSFFNHSPVEEGGIDAIIRGQLSASAQELDTLVVDDLNFGLALGGDVGFSLPAINLARGLDHGLGSYIDVRIALLGGLERDALDPRDFSIITSNQEVQARLAQVYDDVFQVDLWVGGLAEDAIDGTQLGPLFTTIIKDQFIRTRAADESFGQLDPALGSSIIADVENSTFATIIERTTDVDMVQDDVFVAADRSQSTQDSVDTTSGPDLVNLSAVVLQGSLYTGRGDDVVTLSGGSTIDGFLGMAQDHDSLIATSGTITGSVNTGRGDDLVDLQGTAKVLGYVETNSGADQISLSDMAQIRGDLRTGHNDDTVTLSGRAVIAGELCTGRGEDTITLGARTAVEGVVDAGRQDDVIVVETGADVDLIKGGKGFDTLKLGPNTRVELDHNPENGTVFYLDEDGNDTGERVRFRSIENITCFTEGTRIITAQGKRPIESLQVGDAVWTLDAGLQPIAWIGRATVPATGSFAPIRITKDTLGNDRDLLVSAQHRLLLEGWRVEVYCGADEVLAAAKTLVNDTTIRPVEGGDITYIHLAFSDHQIVIAEGIPSESFYPGAQALDALDEATRREVIHLFPEWDCPHLRPQTARQVVRGSEAKILAPTTDCPALRSTD